MSPRKDPSEGPKVTLTPAARRLLALFAGVLTVVGAKELFAPKVPATSSEVRQVASVATEVPRVIPDPKLTPAGRPMMNPSDLPSDLASDPTSQAAKAALTEPHTFEFPDEVKSYLEIQSKVFLSDADKRDRLTLLHHSDLLKALGRRLLEPTLDRQVMREQDAAVDLLLEALHDGDQAVAGQVLESVVKDAQVEDSHMNAKAREQLAGLKAEILYQWSSSSNEAAADLPGWLPGPVSRKIWSNVLKMQQSNLAESEAEAEARAIRH